jgi:predicted negative regulator of RcsB-dependent stress response
MATYDLEQQEQLDEVKHLWKKYGNLVTWVLVLALGGYAAWTGYLYWQQKLSIGAGRGASMKSWTVPQALVTWTSPPRSLPT